jgi:hypothetical protein
MLLKLINKLWSVDYGSHEGNFIKQKVTLLRQRKDC